MGIYVWVVLNARHVGLLTFVVGIVCAAANSSQAQDSGARPRPGPRAATHPAPLMVPNSSARTAAEMKSYVEKVEHAEGTLEMVPIAGGTFVMGSPKGESGRGPEEGPQHKVKVAPFWMGKHEITWDTYEVWMSDLDIFRREAIGIKATRRDKVAEQYQLSQPTEPYTDMSFGMGKPDYPAICMTQYAARTFCKWLTAKTGRYYRLPTEAEWEYACRAGTKTAYHFGDDPSKLGDYAWYEENSNDKYQKVGKKKPNPWGLYDMHGNVAEWVLDHYDAKFYATVAGRIVKNPLLTPRSEYPRVVRGGSWKQGASQLRSAARLGSHEDWKEQDPQVPRSIWYHTDAQHVGFRVVRPLVEPSEKEKAQKWDKALPVEKHKQQIDE